ncbi:MAG TPA: LysE family transporter [Burkholderiaceae bacterium]|nr:LysE family transporter [Burkholderiaceae bacterium]
MFPAVVPGITWRWIFDGLFGVFNEILYRVGFYAETDVPIAWLGQTSTALAATIVANIWRGIPFMMVLLLAGLQSINQEMYEAAAVDGANAFRRFVDITLPSMKGISFVAILLAWIGSFMNFAIVQVMTGGGPANSSEVFATLIYKNAFLYADASYAATLGIMVGDQVLIWLAVAGVAALLATYPAAFAAVQWLGAGYLAYLGVRLLIAKDGDRPTIDIPAGQYFRQSVLITLLNPKAIVFYMAFFPLFIDPRHNLGFVSFAVMAATVAVLTFLYGLVATLLTHGLAERLRADRRIGQVLQKLAGVMLLGFGAKLALN